MDEQVFDQCCQRLKKMRFSGMAAELVKQHRDAGSAEKSFDERIENLINAEWAMREDKKLGRLLKASNLYFQDAVIDPQILEQQKVDVDLVRELAGCEWIRQHKNLLITGKTGSGKSYCACALGISAATKFMTIKYVKAASLLRELSQAEVDNTMNQELTRYSKIDLLIIDDFGLMNLSSTGCRHLFELIDIRDSRKSTIFVSQLPVKNWYDLFKEDTYADACLDRITGKNSYRLVFDGPSLRKAH